MYKIEAIGLQGQILKTRHSMVRPTLRQQNQFRIKVSKSYGAMPIIKISQIETYTNIYGDKIRKVS
jgi:hypothetical protein